VFAGKDIMLRKGGDDIPLFEFGACPGVTFHLVLALRGGVDANGAQNELTTYTCTYSGAHFSSASV
jgi:hypothetical protein